MPTVNFEIIFSETFYDIILNDIVSLNGKGDIKNEFTRSTGPWN